MDRRAGGWIGQRTSRADLALVGILLALGVVGCVDLWIFRGARRWLGVEPGELLPLARTLFAAVLFIPPTSALVGAAFPLACRVFGSLLG